MCVVSLLSCLGTLFLVNHWLFRQLVVVRSGLKVCVWVSDELRDAVRPQCNFGSLNSFSPQGQWFLPTPWAQYLVVVFFGQELDIVAIQTQEGKRKLAAKDPLQVAK